VLQKKNLALAQTALPLLATLTMGTMAKNNTSNESGSLGNLLNMAKKFL
jgi:hypothetical protein